MCLPERRGRRKLSSLGNITGLAGTAAAGGALSELGLEPQSYVSTIYALRITNRPFPRRHIHHIHHNHSNPDDDESDEPVENALETGGEWMGRIHEQLNRLQMLILRARVRGNVQDRRAAMSLIRDLIETFHDRPETHEMLQMFAEDVEQMGRLHRTGQGHVDDDDDDDDDEEDYDDHGYNDDFYDEAMSISENGEYVNDYMYPYHDVYADAPDYYDEFSDSMHEYDCGSDIENVPDVNDAAVGPAAFEAQFDGIEEPDLPQCQEHDCQCSYDSLSSDLEYPDNDSDMENGFFGPGRDCDSMVTEDFASSSECDDEC